MPAKKPAGCVALLDNARDETHYHHVLAMRRQLPRRSEMIRANRSSARISAYGFHIWRREDRGPWSLWRSKSNRYQSTLALPPASRPIFSEWSIDPL